MLNENTIDPLIKNPTMKKNKYTNNLLIDIVKIMHNQSIYYIANIQIYENTNKTLNVPVR